MIGKERGAICPVTKTRRIQFDFGHCWEGSRDGFKKYLVNWHVGGHVHCSFPGPWIALTRMTVLLQEGRPVLFTAVSPRAQNHVW